MDNNELLVVSIIFVIVVGVIWIIFGIIYYDDLNDKLEECGDYIGGDAYDLENCMREYCDMVKESDLNNQLVCNSNGDPINLYLAENTLYWRDYYNNLYAEERA